MAALATKGSYFSRSRQEEKEECIENELSTKMSSRRYVWCVGCNHRGQLGIGNKETQKQLIKCEWSEKIQIRNIYPSNQYTLFEDTDGNYHSCGYNSDRACTVDDKSEFILSVSPITYLKENNLNISQVFVDSYGRAPLWKTDDGSIYTSCDNNSRGRVGVEVNSNKAMNKITFLSPLSIKKMASGYGCSIAICNDGSVYSTGIGDGTGDNGLGAKGVDNKSWKRIESIKDIVDCEFGNEFVVFLSSSGQVFSAGLNDKGQLGLNTKEARSDHIIRNPTQNTYFRQNNITIQSVHCCDKRVVALDSNGNVYQWGKGILCPQRIELKGKIQSIAAGNEHFIFRTEKGQFMSFGADYNGECCRDESNNETPQLINEWILNKIGGANKILSVTPGRDATFIVCTNTDGVAADEDEDPQQNEDVAVQGHQNKEEKRNNVDRVQNVSNSKATQEEKTGYNENPNTSQVEVFLSELGLGQYIAAFDDEGLETMDELEEINDSQLKEIVGVKKLGHRIKILKGIRAFVTDKSFNASSTAHKEELKQNDEEVEKGYIAKNPLCVCVGISEYDGLQNLDTAKDIALYRQVLEDKYRYKVIANDPSQPMNKKDVKQFLRNARKDHLYDFDDDLLYYDALIVTFGSHGTYDSIICSDGTKYKHKDLRKIFLIDELTDIPKVFLIDACRVDDDHDAQSQKGRNAPTASTFSTTLMTSEGNTVYGAQICRFITQGLSASYANSKYTDFRTVYLTAKKRIREATMNDQDLQLCEHDTDIDFVVFKPKHDVRARGHARGTKAKRYYADTKQMSTANFTRTFLRTIGMERYYDAFKAEGLVDEASLKGVNKDTLISLGIKNESSHETIMKAIKNLK